MITYHDRHDAARRVIATDAIKQPPYSLLTPRQWADLVDLYCTENVQPFVHEEQPAIGDPKIVLDDIIRFAENWQPEEGLMETPQVDQVLMLHRILRTRSRT